MTKLRVTQRCLQEDLGLDVEHASREAERFAYLREAVRAFVGKRASAPGVGENISGVEPYGHVKSLHVGRGRGATIHDPTREVCWLLAFSETHATGERRDAYQHFMRLHERDELLPTASDYALLKVLTSASLLDALHRVCAELHEQARRHPGHEVQRTLTLNNDSQATAAVAVDMVIVGDGALEQGWLAITVSPGAPLQPDHLLDIVAALIPPEVDVNDVQFAQQVNGRPVAFPELAVTWHGSTP